MSQKFGCQQKLLNRRMRQNKMLCSYKLILDECGDVNMMQEEMQRKLFRQSLFKKSEILFWKHLMHLIFFDLFLCFYKKIIMVRYQTIFNWHPLSQKNWKFRRHIDSKIHCHQNLISYGLSNQRHSKPFCLVILLNQSYF